MFEPKYGAVAAPPTGFEILRVDDPVYLPVPPEPEGLKAWLQRRHPRVSVLVSVIRPPGSLVRVAWRRVMGYLWREWSVYLRGRITWPVFLRVTCWRRWDAARWVNGDISWIVLVDQVKEDLNLQVGGVR
jgi:hypothetical protein